MDFEISDCSEFNVWVNIIISLIISPSLLILKLIYDRIMNRRRKSLILRNQISLDKISNKLKAFYWPIYIRLINNHNIWLKLHESIYFTEDDTHPVNMDDDIATCIFIGDNVRCTRYVHRNCNGYCIEHCDSRESRTNSSSVNNLELADIGRGNPMNIYFRNKLMLNYTDITAIIFKNIHIAEPNSALWKNLIMFLKFSFIMIGLLKHNMSLETDAYSIHYPHSLLPIIESKLFKLQKQYNTIIENFYYK